MKGQVSFEFLGVIMIAVLIYGIFGLYITMTFSTLLPTDYKSFEARSQARIIAEAVEEAYFAGDGYNSTIRLVDAIGGRDYTVSYNTTNRAVEVDVIDAGEIDSYGTAVFSAHSLVMQNAGPGTNYVANSNGTVAVWRPA